MAVQQNKLAYVTGSSKGIGAALVNLLLKDGFEVVGIARTNSLKHPNFHFIQLDLSDISAVKSFSFEKSAANVILINNAGLIGDINPVGSLDNTAIERVVSVNTIAPQILCNKLVKRFKNEKGHYQILNISSGAAKKPIDAWATYCGSKAAIDLFSETLAEELDWREVGNWHVHSCAPGVVDTQMQVDIRASSEESFKMVEHFKDLKTNNELSTPDYVASKLKMVIDRPKEFVDTVISVRDF